MSWEIGILFALLVVMIYLKLTETLPLDLTAFCGLVILVLGGYVRPDEAFAGFSSPAVITMMSVFIVGASLLHTGVADLVGQRVHEWVGSREVPLTATIMLVVAALSAFMNNIAATAVLMPAVAAIARRANIPPSRLFMPLSFAAILGGTTTLVGTPPNIVTASMLQERGLEPFGLFDFTPVGFVLLLTGAAFMITLGRRLLPRREVAGATDSGADLAEIYHLRERLFSIRLPRDSALAGRTLRETRLGSALGVQVLSIEREGERRLAPEADTVLRGGDVLLVEGRLADARELLRVRGLGMEKAEAADLPRPIKGVSGIRAQLAAGSPLIGKTLRELRFRERFGVVVVGIIRDGGTLRDRLAEESFREGDEILALGSTTHLERLRADPDFVNSRIGLSAIQELRSHLYLLRVPEGSPLGGSTVAASRIGELVGVTVGGIIRGEELRLAPEPEERILPGDLLLVAANPPRVMSLLQLGEVSLESQVAEPALESEEIRVVEVTLAPRSTLAGKTFRDLKFRERYGFSVLALWREGQLVRTNLARLPLRFGDALLLQGSRSKVQQLTSDPDFVMLSDLSRIQRRTSRAPFALGGLLLMVGLVVTGFQPIQVAAFTAATLVILAGATSMQESYRAIEWRIIFLVAAVLPVAVAMERTGAALLLADGVVSLAGPLGPYFVLAAMVALSSLLSQGLDGAPAVVLLAPVVIQTAEQLGLSPYPLMMGISLAASAAFMTPFGHKANLLVMGAGGYKVKDYVKVGTPLTLVLLALVVILVPVFFPF
jgi:di/tricarboxylate transporter